MDFHNLRQLVLNMDALFALKIGIGKNDTFYNERSGPYEGGKLN